ncbi:hypothetical protein CGCA056_v014210 [Colletotrichum aenigma]|uniref:uncharacterized protein n=1 Tax=Colletotrichum aenigma TaxID=1215731 RepID=UPI001872C8CB|nr:uncharacterized protein CGCA056_v014210 [Colletotrichum aenigma]KAF5502847.1 hypothetical protein CGCA056_v014210 [Colletotrichum aenigma]
MAVVSNQQSIMTRVDKYVHAMSNDVLDLQAVQTSTQQDNLYQDVRGWLSSQEDNNANSQLHERNLKAREQGSGEWLFSHNDFQNWLTTKRKGSQTNLWLRGSPGVGKSYLCSTAIEHVSKQLGEICLYYFYRFDDQPETGSSDGIRAAALLVDQLFRHFWKQDQRIAAHVNDYIKTTEKNMTSLAETARLIIKQGNQFSQEKGIAPQANSPSVYLFLDGLDENKHSHAAEDILKLFESVDEEPSILRKTWISSRETNVLNIHLRQWPMVNVDKHAEVDVKDFLTRMVPKLERSGDNVQDVEGQPLDEWVLQKLQAKAESNFLYARLMVEWLKEDVFTIDDVITFIKSRVPNNIAEMYKRIFRQYQKDQHRYISILFSLVAFARRPLRLYELREAMTIALSERDKGLDPRKVPRNLHRLFAPLVETQSDPKEPDNPFCRLCHSTVQEFLVTHPDVLSDRTSNQASIRFQISASEVGDVCLRYLSQSRYSTFVGLAPGECHIPLGLTYDDAQQHGLLPYSAKYWDRHLEDVEPTQERREELLKFLQSPNFQTLIQVQSLFVTGHFTQFRLIGSDLTSRPMYRRALPDWFGLIVDKDVEFIKLAEKFRRDYRHFMHEWGYLLEHGICASDTSAQCLRQYFCGEVDRCLTGLLGPEHFMNRMKEKYPSFMLTNQPFNMHKSEELIIADAVCVSKSQFIVLSSTSKELGQVSLDTWDFGVPGVPRCVSRSTIFASNIDLQSNAGSSIAFSNAVATVLSNMKDYGSKLILSHGTHSNLEPLSTDVAMRDGIIVVASRNVHRHLKEKSAKGKAGRKHTAKLLQGLYSDSSETGSDEDSEDEYSADENSAYETCSDGSTDFDSDESEEEITGDDMDSDEQSDEYLDDDTDEEENEIEPADGEAEAEIGQRQKRKQRLVANYQMPAESNLELEGDLLKQEQKDRPTYPGMPSRVRDPKDRITTTIAVYDMTSGDAVRLFHYDHDTPVTCMLYHSPPVLHPKKALVVWPSGGGEVLFADFEEKTYFIRAIMPTTRDS